MTINEEKPWTGNEFKIETLLSSVLETKMVFFGMVERKCDNANVTKHNVLRWYLCLVLSNWGKNDVMAEYQVQGRERFQKYMPCNVGAASSE